MPASNKEPGCLFHCSDMHMSSELKGKLYNIIYKNNVPQTFCNNFCRLYVFNILTKAGEALKICLYLQNFCVGQNGKKSQRKHFQSELVSLLKSNYPVVRF